jgi:hypothetical protein
MRVKTFIELQWKDGRYHVVREEGFEYLGPVARCDRGTSKQVAQQGMAQSSQDQGNAQVALSSTNTSLGKYNDALNNFMRFGRATYGPNGEYMRDTNTLATTTAAAGEKALEGDLALEAGRTGENTAGYAGTVALDKQQNAQAIAAQLAQADQSRLQALTNINQYGVQASALPAEIQAQIYGTSTGGASSNLGPAASAAAQPSGWDVFGTDLAAAAGGVAQAFKPSK